MKGLMIFAAAITCALSLQYKPSHVDWNVIGADEWWGPEETRANQDTSIRPFKMVFDDEMIEDLRYRIKNHRNFKPPLKDVGFTYGFNSNAMPYWLSYWAESYPFKEREAHLNQFPQFKTNIQGLDIQFLWIKPENPEGKTVVPVLMMHGWSGSIIEFYQAIPLLTAVDDSRNYVLELVIPSLPGFGFSDSAVKPGLGGIQMAIVMRNLMQRLGYKKFAIQGGDWGSFIGSNIATLYSEEVIGYHTNWPLVLSVSALALHLLGQFGDPSLVVDPSLADRMYPLSAVGAGLLEEGGFLIYQSAKPDTIGFGLTDSPAGLLAYLLEKFSTHVVPTNKQLEDGGLKNTWSPDTLIDNLMMYWVTGCITTSMRPYAETYNKHEFSMGFHDISTPVPTIALMARYELVYQSSKILKLKYSNLLNHTALDYGGHFFAFERPEVYSDAVIRAMGDFLVWNAENEIGY